MRSQDPSGVLIRYPGLSGKWIGIYGIGGDAKLQELEAHRSSNPNLVLTSLPHPRLTLSYFYIATFLNHCRAKTLKMLSAKCKNPMRCAVLDLHQSLWVHPTAK
jgi:hypothetical protein